MVDKVRVKDQVVMSRVERLRFVSCFFLPVLPSSDGVEGLMPKGKTNKGVIMHTKSNRSTSAKWLFFLGLRAHFNL